MLYIPRQWLFSATVVGYIILKQVQAMHEP